uniref:hypothetical protein n=1 Tax=Paenarthrobacter ureafaciens TaxID=37931 RepID=UPI003F491BD9
MGEDDTRTKPEAAKAARRTKPKRKSFPRRQELARQWLERLVPPERITDERVNELAAVVDRYRPGSKFLTIADAMIRNNETPTMKKVAARYESRKNAYLRRNAPAVPVELTPAMVDQLTTMIRASWERRGHGPAWSEIGTVMGWDRAQTRHALTSLRTDRAISFTDQAGSLTLTGKAAHRSSTARKSA